MSEYQVDHWDDSGMTNQVDQIWEVFGMEEKKKKNCRVSQPVVVTGLN